MSSESHQKVMAAHLSRNAYLYIRQSTLRQVHENTESTQRQYALRQRAVALGWPAERLIVIDCDLGQSGASTIGREGFQRLVADVGMGRAGIVMGLEVSRLARNSSDWHRLLEICALTDTLILDEDGIYDPAHFNDRLLLGLKGTMSEAELHVLRARLRGALLAKARRGELKTPLPVGFCHAADGSVLLDPDVRTQETIRSMFTQFRCVGSASGVVKAFRRQGLLFPYPVTTGVRSGETIWRTLTLEKVLRVLHNPRYAGAFAYGQKRAKRRADGRVVPATQRREDWIALHTGVHEGYLSWDDFEENQKILLENARAHGHERRAGPPREGTALLQGLAICGRCGHRMTVRYNGTRRGAPSPYYICQIKGIARAEPPCQVVHGTTIDETVGRLLVDMVTPVALETALAVQEELQSRVDEADRLRGRRVEAAKYESDMARRRFLQVNPDNRLVADTLEGDWNEKLRALAHARDECERGREADRVIIDSERRNAILALATDFPKLWNAATTAQRERKRLLRLLVEDVTIAKAGQISVHVRFRGGTTQSVAVSPPPRAHDLFRTSPELIAAVDELLDHHHEGEIVEILNKRGQKPGEGGQITRDIVRHIRKGNGLKKRYARLREAGLLTTAEIARRLRISPWTVRDWRRRGRLAAVVYNERGEHLFQPPDPANLPRRHERGVNQR